MRFTTRLLLLFTLVLAVFVLSTLPMTAALFRGAEKSARQADWDRVVELWGGLDAETQGKTRELMAAVGDWKAASAAPSLAGDARYLKFQTDFLMFSAVQAFVLLLLAALGLRLLMAPVRNMAKVVDRLKAGDSEARLGSGGGVEWQALAHQFNTMLDQNQTLSRLQGWQEVASFLSHQIKNPLTAIAFAEQNVRSLAELPPLAAENLAIIGEQGRRINNLIRRLRDLTSFDQMARVPVDFSAWMEAWAAGRKREGEAWTVSIADTGNVPLVTLLWEQALDNLLANSREACAGVAELHLAVERRENVVTVDWADGNQVAAGTKLDLVGTARFTTKKDGSGLGVFFVRRIAELHGGSLAITPSPQGGLHFQLTLEGGGHGAHPRRR